MSFKIIHQGALADDFKLKAARTPSDIHAGYVAGLSGDSEVDLCTVATSGTFVPVGIFAYEGDNGALLPSPTKVHRQITIAKAMGSYETSIYETAPTYNLGDYLYTSANAKLTNVKPSDSGGVDYVIGLVTKVPGADLILGFDLRI